MMNSALRGVTRRGFLAAIGFLMAAAAPVAAQTYPDKPVTLVVGYNPGGGVDISARLVANYLSKKWGQPVVVQNTPGAGGNVAAAGVAKAAADGYTLLFGTTNLTIPGDVELTFDPVKSFEPIAIVAYSPSFLLVNAEVPVKTLDELIAYAKANPDALSFGNAGAKTRANLEFEEMAKAAGIVVTPVTYKGAAEAVVALLANEIQLLRQSVASSAEHVKAGTLRALAISGNVADPAFPDVPVYADLVKDHAELKDTEQTSGWYGVMAPAGTPVEALDKIHADVSAALTDAEVTSGLTSQGLIAGKGSREDFAKLIKDDISKW